MIFFNERLFSNSVLRIPELPLANEAFLGNNIDNIAIDIRYLIFEKVGSFRIELN